MRLMTLILLLMPSTRLVPKGHRQCERMPRQVAFEVAGEGFERLDAASHGPAVPLLPAALGAAAVPAVPQRFEVVLHHIDGEEHPVGFEQVAQAHQVLSACDVAQVACQQPASAFDSLRAVLSPRSRLA